jgi:predicted HD phosphohydrolase
MVEKNSQIPQLPFQEDFYYRDSEGKEIPYEFQPMLRQFIREVWESKYLFENKKRILYALRLAIESHAGQTRREKPSLPYILHPVEAALNALRDGQSAVFVVSLLLHDTREDTWIRLQNRKFVQELFRGRLTELITSLLSRHRYIENPETHEKELVKISDKEYAGNLKSSHTAVEAKHYDTTRANLRSDGRRLQRCFEVSPEEAAKIIANIKRFISQVKEFFLPIEAEFYRELHQETCEMILTVEIRMQVVEAWLAANSSEVTEESI